MRPDISAILGPPPDNDLDALIIAFSFARSERSKGWQRMELTWPAFARRLTQHKVGDKTGTAITPAVFEGPSRSVRSAIEIRVAVLDSDKGTTFSEIASRIRTLGLAAAIATSHSHQSTELLVPRTTWDSWLKSGPDRTPESFLLAQGYRSSVADAAIIKLDEDHQLVTAPNESDVQCVVIQHRACAKVRVFLPVKERWRAADGPTIYRKGLESLALDLGVTADPSGMEPSHLFFEPRFRRDGPTPQGLILKGELANPWGTGARKANAATGKSSAAVPASFSPADDNLAAISREIRRRNVGMSFALFQSAVMAIRNDERYDSFPSFIRILGGICEETGKSEEGWALACRWIESRIKGDNDPARSREYWDGLRLPATTGDATGATIVYLARQDGWQPPAETQVMFGDLDMGVAFANEFRGQLIYVNASDEWLRWNCDVWTKAGTSDMEAIAKNSARRAHDVASKQYRENPSEVTKSSLMRANRYIDSIDRTRKIIEAGWSELGMNLQSRGDFDFDRMSLGVLNGAIDLKTGKFFNPNPEHYISKQAGASFDAKAQCPRYLKFLSKIQPDPEVRRFLQRWIGYVLTGQVGELKWLFCYGTGSNGKTALVNIISMLLGEYVFHADSSLLTQNKHENEAARQIAQLPGKRLISANETARGDIFDDERMKRLVSQEPISARFLHRETFNFNPTGKLILQGNHRPIVQDDSNGFWRRMVLMHFPVQLSQREIIKDIDKILFEAECQGMLNWAIEGCLEWQARGLCPPDSLEKDKEDYKAESDTLGQWIEQCCVARQGVAGYLSDFYRSYVQHHQDQGLSTISQPSFTRAMRHRGFPKGGSKGQPKLLDIKLSRDF